ncbi:type II toxin-antitoxin system RelE/ParE family toxin [Breoghania sp. L-A4]|uniref:type II toxin-antitoxin system RelE/ParE family toxin n=1 Tax=Breoghania sp. L-A4 TaxID=2304600 RepID=UPI0013C2CEB0|nr:type II toxin-antitoxin system RelE/ParE family toxin [Breoghania sp. L-A4]
MSYRLSRQAVTDLEDLTEYGIERFGQSQAQKYLGGLYRTFELISELPAMGREFPGAGSPLRRFEHGRHSVFYTLQSEDVLIARVIDNRRDMRRQFGPVQGQD